MRKVQKILLDLVRLMEVGIAIFLLVAIFVAIFYTCQYFGEATMDGTFTLDTLMGSVLTLVVGIEFAKMLILHTTESVVEVLLYAVARQVVISHGSTLEILIGVLAIAIIFIIKKYFFKHSVQKENSLNAEK